MKKHAPAALQDELLGIERRLWTNDADFYEKTLLPEALLIFPETGVIRREEAVAAIRRENAEGRRWAEVEFSDVHLESPAANVALLTYRATARWSHETDRIVMLATSAYVRRQNGWRLALHQQTPPASDASMRE